MMPALFYFMLTLFTGIYDFVLPAGPDKQINFQDYKGKKILIVNIGFQSPQHASQLSELKQFDAMHKDSIQVVGILSHQFSQLSDQQVADSLTRYQLTFPVSDPILVAGSDIHLLYQWLTRREQNGMMNNPVENDFYRFLINREGKLIACFTNHESILGANMQSAIKY